VKAFADGTEKHIAQIAPAGSWRVWAEPETGGEAYLPLAPSKRGRSKEILDQVAEMFGGQVVYNAAGSITASDLYRAGRASSNSTRPAAAPGQMALVGGDLILQRPQQESTQDSLAAAMFELRRIRLGGGGNA
jgi:hypothetical protein